MEGAEIKDFTTTSFGLVLAYLYPASPASSRLRFGSAARQIYGVLLKPPSKKREVSQRLYFLASCSLFCWEPSSMEFACGLSTFLPRSTGQ
jgi:hypothetical protein